MGATTSQGKGKRTSDRAETTKTMKPNESEGEGMAMMSGIIDERNTYILYNLRAFNLRAFCLLKIRRIRSLAVQADC